MTTQKDFEQVAHTRAVEGCERSCERFDQVERELISYVIKTGVMKACTSFKCPHGDADTCTITIRQKLLNL